jgi:hypothetical protein
MPTLRKSPARSCGSWAFRSASAPFRVHVDPSQDGAEIVNGVGDRMRREMYRNIGLEDLLHPAIIV